jgi:hypothetical protein
MGKVSPFDKQVMTKAEFIEYFRAVLAEHAEVRVYDDHVELVLADGHTAEGWPMRCPFDPCHDPRCKGWVMAKIEMRRASASGGNA